MEKVEAKLKEHGAIAPVQRRAHFVSALCVAWADGHIKELEAQVHGTLVWPPRGTKGFGYDPMFLPDDQAIRFVIWRIYLSTIQLRIVSIPTEN